MSCSCPSRDPKRKEKDVESDPTSRVIVEDDSE